jgi:hypothetical protein
VLEIAGLAPGPAGTAERFLRLGVDGSGERTW